MRKAGDVMKKIEAIIRTERAWDIKNALAIAGFSRSYYIRSKRTGREKGVVLQIAAHRQYRVDMLAKNQNRACC